MEESECEEEEELRTRIKNSVLSSDHPYMQDINMVFSRLVRASGLDDRDWDLRVVWAPSE